MSVAALRDELERELAAWALAGMGDSWGPRPPRSHERWEMARPLLEAHLPVGSALRLPLPLMPDWYRQQWHDPTQIDGRATVMEVSVLGIRVTSVAPSHYEGVFYTVDREPFLDAVLAGRVGDAT